jgi:hypothetical protein
MLMNNVRFQFEESNTVRYPEGVRPGRTVKYVEAVDLDVCSVNASHAAKCKPGQVRLR